MKKSIKPIWKKVKVSKPYCPNCKQFLRGNGSAVIPYHCDCGVWEYNYKSRDYELEVTK